MNYRWAALLGDNPAYYTDHAILLVENVKGISDAINKVKKELGNYSLAERNAIVSTSNTISRALQINAHYRFLAPDTNYADNIEHIVNTFVGDKSIPIARRGMLTILWDNSSAMISHNNRVTMPNGQDGLNCINCTNFYPYVEPNQGENYICFNCR